MSACTLFKLKLGTGSCAFINCSKLQILVNCRMFCISVCTGFMYVSLYTDLLYILDPANNNKSNIYLAEILFIYPTKKETHTVQLVKL